MRIVLLESFFGGSHRRWAEGLQRNSGHQIEILSLPARHWKWRMHGSAVSLAKRFAALSSPDLILATDMLDLTTFLALIRKLPTTPVALYFHENQLTYPWSPDDPDTKSQRDNHYAWINYTSACAADAIFFNSAYHKTSFLSALPKFLDQFPDDNQPTELKGLENKSSVLSLGMDLPSPKERVQVTEKKKKLWNHRWEYDKNPDLFFKTLFRLKEEGVDFKLIVCGEHYKNSPGIFKVAQERLKDHIHHFGFVDSKEKYLQLLYQADLLPVTSFQDFFGGSVVEGIAAGVVPLLPNRLAYPEHIPLDLQNRFLYSSNEDFYTRLKALLQDTYPKSAMEQLYPIIQAYDWKACIQNYDDSFSKFVESHSS